MPPVYELSPAGVSRGRIWLQARERRVLLSLGDAVVVLVATLLSLVIWVVVDGRGSGAHFVAAHLYQGPILVVAWFALAHLNGFYDLRTSARLEASLLRLIQVNVQLVVFFLVIFFLSPHNSFQRLFVLVYAVISFVCVGLWRAFRPFGLADMGGPRRAVLVGDGPDDDLLLAALRDEAPEVYTLCGRVTSEEDLLSGVHPADRLPVLGPSRDLVEIARKHRVQELIVLADSKPSAGVLHALLDCYEHGVSVVSAPLVYEQITGRVPIDLLESRAQIDLLPEPHSGLFDPYLVVKRAMDVLLSLVGLAMFVPLLPVIWITQQIDSPGALFIRQQRVGQSGRVFELIKLRSMIPDAERDTGPQWSPPDDPRITRVGRVLRRTGLDEFPQLINVLRGEMCLIGPRPERPEFVSMLNEAIPVYRARHAIQPGISGWAQVRYRYGSSVEDARIKLQYDLYYVRYRSFALDMLILVQTLVKMITLRGD